MLELAEFKEEKNDPKWIDAMKEELRMIEKNQTWELVDMPKHWKPIGVKWIDAMKEELGMIEKNQIWELVDMSKH